MHDYFVYQGNTEIRGSRDATREAFATNLISDGDSWMEMIKNRNLTSHTYKKVVSQEIYDNIINSFHNSFLEIQKNMRLLAKNN